MALWSKACKKLSLTGTPAKRGEGGSRYTSTLPSLPIALSISSSVTSSPSSIS
jgi:hypothetical protein